MIPKTKWFGDVYRSAPGGADENNRPDSFITEFRTTPSIDCDPREPEEGSPQFFRCEGTARLGFVHTVVSVTIG